MYYFEIINTTVSFDTFRQFNFRLCLSDIICHETVLEISVISKEHTQNIESYQTNHIFGDLRKKKSLELL